VRTLDAPAVWPHAHRHDEAQPAHAVSVAPVCARCGGAVRPPGLWSSRWRCEHDGTVEPWQRGASVSLPALEQLATRAQVPVWVLAPPPVGWTVCGFAWAGDERGGTRATALALSGPSPLGGPADLLLIAEEPGVGVGARYSGLPGLDAGEFATGLPYAKVEVGGHPVALWACPGAPDDRAVFVGEAHGSWLWAVLWPAAAAALLLEHLVLADVRDGVPVLELGAPTSRLG
jgi:hypothetical protein